MNWKAQPQSERHVKYLYLRIKININNSNLNYSNQPVKPKSEKLECYVYSKCFIVNNYLCDMTVSERIAELLLKNGQMNVQEITDSLSVSRQYVHRQLLQLITEGKIRKYGIPPRVFYVPITDKLQEAEEIIISLQQEQFLKLHFIQVDPTGNMTEGLEAMRNWCHKQHLPLKKTIDEYILTRKKYLNFFTQDNLIDGYSKISNTKGIGPVSLDALYYFDFYAIERFGKTRLGTLMHFAKLSQNRMLMQLIASEIKQRVINVLHHFHIDAIVFVPPSISRKIQIMYELERFLALKLPKIKVTKIKTGIVVPQKALSRIYDRVENARNTFYVGPPEKYKTILLIDDAVGSGATMNEIAAKIKKRIPSAKVMGLAIAGSYKEFEVISEL